MCISNLPSFKQCSSVSSVSTVSGSHLDWTGSFCWSVAWLGIQLQMSTSLTHSREREWCTGRVFFLLLFFFCCHSLLMQEVHDFEMTLTSWLGPHTVFASLKALEPFVQAQWVCPGTVRQSFPLPFNFSSRCNYCNALRLGATLEDQSEPTAATHCGFPLARNCSPQATCHNNSFNTLYRFAFLMFKVALIWIRRDMGKLAPLC